MAWRWFRWGAAALALAVHLGGLFLPLSEPDESLYAVLAREMASSHQWGALTLHGEAWVDKPHFPFWCAALSMRLLGATPFAYRLPAFLWFLVGLGYTWALGRRYLARDSAGWAVLMTLTAFHLVLSNHDVRAEPYLLGMVSMALFHLVVALEEGGAGQAALAGLAIGLGVITKGTFLLLPTVGAAAVVCWARRQRPAWAQVGALGVTMLVPVGMGLAALATQHGGTGSAAALRLLFWDGQLGRFLNAAAAPRIPESGPLYFVHTLAWAFAPWSPSLAIRSAQGAWRGWRRPWWSLSQLPLAEGLVVASATIAFVLFSASRFQLPYYLNFEMPMFALIAARVRELPRALLAWRLAATLQVVGAVVLTGGAVALLHLAEVPGAWVGAGLAGLPLAVLALRRRFGDQWAWDLSLASAVVLALVLNALFTPWLAQAEAGYLAGLAAASRPRDRAYSVEYVSYAYDFYASADTGMLAASEASTWRLPAGSLVYLGVEHLAAVEAARIRYAVVRRFLGTRVSQPRLQFLNPATRAGSLRESVLIEIQ